MYLGTNKKTNHLSKPDSQVVFVTAFTPFGSGEFFTLDEIYALKIRGVKPVIVPRSYGDIIIHNQSRHLIDQTLNHKLLDVKTLSVFVRSTIKKPLKIASLISWCWQWSWSLLEFIKALVVLPKALRIAEELNNYDFEHVHSTNTTTMAIIAYTISQENNVPWSFTLHSWWPRFQKRKKHFETMIESASFCRVISEKACRELKDLIDSTLHSKCFTVHIGTECVASSCARLPVKGIFTIVTPAGLQRHKGHHIALESGRILLARGVNNYRWIFYGEGPELTVLQKSIDSMKLHDHFKISGVIKNFELLHDYRNGLVQIVVLPSIEDTGMPEGIPHALIQAMGFGIPVVSTNSGGTSELTGYGAGTIVPQNDPLALADAVQHLITDNEFYFVQAENARQRASESFNFDITCKQIIELFRIDHEIMIY